MHTANKRGTEKIVQQRITEFISGIDYLELSLALCRMKQKERLLNGYIGMDQYIFITRSESNRIRNEIKLRYERFFLFYNDYRNKTQRDKVALIKNISFVKSIITT